MDKTNTLTKNTSYGKKRRFKKVLVSLFLLFVLLLQGCADEKPQFQAGEAGQGQAAEVVHNSGELAVHYIDVGQGDATLITCGGSSMLIDAGNNNMGTTVQYYLSKQGITKLNYVVGTHPDADHIGGLDVVLYKFDCETFFMPDIEKNTKTYQEVVDVAGLKRLTISHPEEGDSYALGDASFTILSPSVAEGEQDANNSSIVIRLLYGESSFLFSGDAEAEEEQAILDSGQRLSSTVYKVAHHGSSGANSKPYLDAVSPKYAVISCGKDNSYGHPHKEVLQMLQDRGITTYRTDEQGTIIVYSDGETISFQQEGQKDTGRAENKSMATTQNKSESEEDYILNTNTKKIHLKTCSSVADIHEENRLESKETLTVLMKQGYTPCKRCIGY